MTIASALRLILVMVLWAGCFPLITLGLDKAPHLAFAAIRAALAGVCLLLLGAALRRPLPRGLRAWGLVSVSGLGATTFGFLGMFHAAEFVSPGLATVIANVQPLLAALLAGAFLGERQTLLGVLGLIVGLAGIGAIATPGFAPGHSQDYPLGIAYVALAAAGVATGNVAMKRLAGETDAVMAMGFQLLIGATPLALLSASTEDVASLAWSPEFVLLVFVLSVFGTSLAFWLWFTTLERTSLNKANAFTFLTPVIALVIGAIAFGERLTWSQAIGAALILGGVALVQRDYARASRR